MAEVLFVVGEDMSAETETIAIPKRLFEELLEDAMDLLGQNDWWKNEPRCNYQRTYNELSARIAEGVRLRDAGKPDA